METVAVETVRSANISDALFGRAPSFARRVPFSIPERLSICQGLVLSRLSPCRLRKTRTRAALRHRRHSRRHRSQSGHCPPPFRFRYRASPSFCCGSPRTNDDASHPKRFHLVLRPAKATGARRLHVCPCRLLRPRFCLRCCSKRALPPDPPPRILEFLQAESSLKR